MTEEKKFYPACPMAGIVFAPAPNPNKSLENPDPYIIQPSTVPCVPGRCPLWIQDPDSDNPEDGDCAFRTQGIAAQEVANAAVVVSDFIDELMHWQLPELIYAILYKYGIGAGFIRVGEFDDTAKKREEHEVEEEPEADEEYDEEPEEVEEPAEPEKPEPTPAPTPAPAPVQAPAPAPAPIPAVSRVRKPRKPRV